MLAFLRRHGAPAGKGSWLTGAVDAAVLEQKVVGMVQGERGFSKPPVVAIPAAALREAGSAADSVWKQLCEQDRIMSYKTKHKTR